MTWADLFERAESYETDVETIREALAARREGRGKDAEPRAEDDDA